MDKLFNDWSKTREIWSPQTWNGNRDSLYVTGLWNNGLIAGLAEIDFFPEKASTKFKVLPTQNMSALLSCAFTL